MPKNTNSGKYLFLGIIIIIIVGIFIYKPDILKLSSLFQKKPGEVQKTAYTISNPKNFTDSFREFSFIYPERADNCDSNVTVSFPKLAPNESKRIDVTCGKNINFFQITTKATQEDLTE